MEIKNSFAGTLESGDIMIKISPSADGKTHIELDSTVAFQFGDRIKEVIAETLKENDLEGVTVSAIDKGALDCTIRARVATAAVRATGKDIWKD